MERIGVARAAAAVVEADVLLWLDDAPPPRGDGTVSGRLTSSRPPVSRAASTFRT